MGRRQSRVTQPACFVVSCCLPEVCYIIIHHHVYGLSAACANVDCESEREEEESSKRETNKSGNSRRDKGRKGKKKSFFILLLFLSSTRDEESALIVKLCVLCFSLPSVAIQFTRNIPCRHGSCHTNSCTSQGLTNEFLFSFFLFFFSPKNTKTFSHTRPWTLTLSRVCELFFGSSLFLLNWKPFSFSFSSLHSLLLLFCVCPFSGFLGLSLPSRLQPKHSDWWFSLSHSLLVVHFSPKEKQSKTFPTLRLRWLIDEHHCRGPLKTASRDFNFPYDDDESLIERLRKSIFQPSTSLSLHSSYYALTMCRRLAVVC